MDQGIEIYGTHVGGGWSRTPEEDDASIQYAVGQLSGSDLTIVGWHRCGDREELLGTIDYLGGPWGLAFPFALPAWTYPKFSNRDWPDLLEFANSYEEAQIDYLIKAAGLDDLEGECRRPGGMCRVTDAESGALSPLKRYDPNRLRVTHRGLRLLRRLRGYGASVYPFDAPGRARPRLYEVYPAGTYARLGLGDAPGPRDFVEAFNHSGKRAVRLRLGDSMTGAYALDAVVSCATLANAIRASDLDARWDEMPAFATAPEWEIRLKEGLIVRL